MAPGIRHGCALLSTDRARQVGTSFLVRMLAEETFDNLVEINFELDPEARSLFAPPDPRIALPLVEARYGQPIRPGSTLLFLDEIQAAPELFAGLRYFREQLPELHVIAAGSLLDFALAEHGFTVPVGRIEYLNLGPMTFEEFLRALDRESLVTFLADFRIGMDMPRSIHDELLRLLRQYLVVGGMPASIEAFLGAGSHRDSEAERQAILEDRARDLSRGLDLLCMSRMTYRVRHTSGNGVPLGAEADDRNFKVLFLDVGLLSRSCGLSVLDMERAEDVTMVNSGGVAEQFVGQHLQDGHAQEPACLSAGKGTSVRLETQYGSSIPARSGDQCGRRSQPSVQAPITASVHDRAGPQAGPRASASAGNVAGAMPSPTRTTLREPPSRSSGGSHLRGEGNVRLKHGR